MQLGIILSKKQNHKRKIKMAKTITLIALIVSAFCFSSVFAKSTETFHVEGKVYCDPCRLQFETKLSRPLSGVKIQIECKKLDDGSVTYSVDGYTNNNGYYNIPVDGDHDEELCEVKTMVSDHPDCNEAISNGDSDKVVLTTNMGVSSWSRFVNPLGFMTKTIDPKCAEIVKELDLNNKDDD